MLNTIVRNIEKVGSRIHLQANFPEWTIGKVIWRNYSLTTVTNRKMENKTSVYKDTWQSFGLGTRKQDMTTS